MIHVVSRWLFVFFVFGAFSLLSAQDRYQGRILEKGASSKDQTQWIMLLQYDLYFLGYGVYFEQYGGVTGNYQEETVRAVKAFQYDHGLIADGVMARKTATEIERALEASDLGKNWKLFDPMRYKGQRIRKGDLDELTRNTVSQLRGDLTLLGYNVSGDPRGVFGDETEKALKSFQEINLLPNTGILDDRTVITLAEKICMLGKK